MNEENAAKGKYRNFICTINFAHEQYNHYKFLPDFTKIPGIKLVTLQLEKASLIHWQLFVEQTKASTASALARRVKRISHIDMHVSIPYKIDGKWPHADYGRAYVLKEDTSLGIRHLMADGKWIVNEVFTMPEWPRLPNWENNERYSVENYKAQLRENLRINRAYLLGHHISHNEDFEECQESLEDHEDRQLSLIDEMLQKSRKVSIEGKVKII